MGPIKFLELVKFLGLFQCRGDSFPHDRCRVLESRFNLPLLVLEVLVLALWGQL